MRDVVCLERQVLVRHRCVVRFSQAFLVLGVRTTHLVGGDWTDQTAM